MNRFSASLFAALLFSTGLAAQDVEITAEPHHHQILSNDQVRVFDVVVPPRESTLMHWHRHDYALVVIGESKVVNDVKGKPPSTIALHDGDVIFSPATFAHLARNLADTPFRNIAVEFLHDDELRKLPAAKDAASDKGLEVLQGGTQQFLWTHDGVRASLYDIQPGGVIPVARDFAGPLLLIALNDYALRSSRRSKTPAAFSMQPGDVKWLPDNFTQSLTNASDGAARFIALDFP